MQAADVLADPKTSVWVVALGQAVADIDCSKGQGTQSDILLSSLLTLPPHLLHAVLTHTCQQDSLARLLHKLPPALHGSLLTASVADGGLTIPENTCCSTLLATLATLQLPAPGLRQLDLDRNALSRFDCALLARAALAHTNLTSLNIGKCFFTEPELRAFTAALRTATPPSLSTLTIAAYASPASCTALADCLSILPSISKLHATLFRLEETGADASLTSITDAAACQVHMPHLSEFAINEVQAGFDHRTHASTAPLLLQLIRAPRLLSIDIFSVSSRLAHAHLLAAVMPFQALRRAKIHTDSKTFVTLFRPPKTTDGVMFPALQDLTVMGGHVLETLYLAAGTAGGASRTLTTLSIQHEKTVIEGAVTATTPALIEHVSRELWQQVGRCTQLRALNFNTLCWPFAGDAGHSIAHSGVLAESLARLKSLTRLQLQACDAGVTPQACCVLDGAVLGSAVSQLTSLQTLHVLGGCAGLLELLRPDALLVACAEVGLQELGLTAQGVTLAHVAEALPQLKSLTSLHLSRGMYDAEGGVEGGAELLAAGHPWIQFTLLDKHRDDAETAEEEADGGEADGEEADDEEAE